MATVRRDKEKLVILLGGFDMLAVQGFFSAENNAELAEVKATKIDDDLAIVIEKSTIREDVIKPLLAQSNDLIAAQKLALEHVKIVIAARALHKELKQRTVVSEGNNGNAFYKAWNKFDAVIKNIGENGAIQPKKKKQ